MRLLRRSQKGQTLLEILLAFSVSVLLMSAVILGVTTSLSNTQYTKNQNQANSYAQEAMAIVRRLRDSGWTDFESKTSNTTYCLDQGSTILRLGTATPPLRCGQNVGIFAREIILIHNKDDSSNGCSGGSKVTVKTSWADNKCPAGGASPLCHSVELITCLVSIDLKPTP